MTISYLTLVFLFIVTPLSIIGAMDSPNGSPVMLGYIFTGGFIFHWILSFVLPIPIIRYFLKESEGEKLSYKGQNFNKKQLVEIQLGKTENLDISIYANPKFDAGQMAQIRIGLSEGIDVSQYAKPEFTWKQMKEIRLELEKELKNK